MTDRKDDKKDQEEQNSGRQTDKQIERLMREWKMEPSEETKRKSLQKAMSGIEEARSQKTKIKKLSQMKNWAKGMSLGVLAAALFSLVLINFDEFQSLIGLGPGSTGDNGTPEANVNDTESIEEQDYDPDSYPEVDRPDTKEIITTVEGMDEENTYNLLDDPDMPFTTYIKDNYQYEMEEGLYESEASDGKGIRISQKGSNLIIVDILFFEEDVEYDQAIEYAKAQMEEDMFHVEQLQEDDFDALDAWATDVFVSTGEVHARMAVGTDKDGRSFYIYTHFIQEALDGWYSVKEVIVDEWEWKQTGESLIE